MGLSSHFPFLYEMDPALPDSPRDTTPPRGLGLLDFALSFGPGGQLTCPVWPLFLGGELLQRDGCRWKEPTLSNSRVRWARPGRLSALRD